MTVIPLNGKSPANSPTKKQIRNYHMQIGRWEYEQNVLCELLKGRIADFYKEYRVTLDSISQDLNKLTERFIVKDEEGKVKTDESGKLVIKEGETEYNFNMNWDKLMNASIYDKFEMEEFIEPQPEEKSEQ